MNCIYYSCSCSSRRCNPYKQMGHILFSNEDLNFPIRTGFVRGGGGWYAFLNCSPSNVFNEIILFRSLDFFPHFTFK